MLYLLQCVGEHTGDAVVVHAVLFCRESVIPSCADGSCFACFLKTEQRESVCLQSDSEDAPFLTSDVRLNSSMSG